MAGTVDKAGGRGGNRWRIAGWGVAVFILVLPFVAMQVTSEVNWTLADFIFAGVMLAVAGGTFELAARIDSGWYRGGAAVAILASFMLIWVNAAVGFLGDEDNPANLMFLGVIALAIIGSVVARFRAGGMATAMTATAVGQVLVGAVGLAAGWASPGADGIYEVVMGTSLFGGLWLLSAWLFREAVTSHGQNDQKSTLS